jgi:hypothetical protein
MAGVAEVKIGVLLPLGSLIFRDKAPVEFMVILDFALGATIGAAIGVDGVKGTGKGLNFGLFSDTFLELL